MDANHVRLYAALRVVTPPGYRLEMRSDWRRIAVVARPVDRRLRMLFPPPKSYFVEGPAGEGLNGKTIEQMAWRLERLFPTWLQV